MPRYRKKLIEVALPLEDINVASAREKSIRHGHPSTLHLWWARRPLAAARAVLFAQMVDDPSEYVDELRLDMVKVKEAEKSLGRKVRGDKDAAIDAVLVEQERERLFNLIRELVKWENTTNETVLKPARARILESWKRTCVRNGDPVNTPLPAFHDPFAGGGAIPLEAQRLGLESYASDLNPVAVLINKAMIEIPPKFAGKPPVHPAAREEKGDQGWPGASGLAEDVRRYGEWMREEAFKRIGHLYPPVEVTADMALDRPDLKPLIGQKLTVMAWIWARTVKSPNPACSNVEVPLASTFILSAKPGKEAYVQPIIWGGSYRFEVKIGKPSDSQKAAAGTKASGRGANFSCILSSAPISGQYVKSEAQQGRLGSRLLAAVAEGGRGRVYLSPTEEMEKVAKAAPTTKWRPEGQVPSRLTGGTCYSYGLESWDRLFTARQLVALTTFSDLIHEARDRIKIDAVAAGLPNDLQPLNAGGNGALSYADAISVYLNLALSKVLDRSSSICGWDSSRESIRNTFGRQAIPMVWDFAECNTLSESSGSTANAFTQVIKSIEQFSGGRPGFVTQNDAQTQSVSINRVVSTDPPYFDNIGYADLSDFFYVWLRKNMSNVFPDLFYTLAVPKDEELVATAYRHGGRGNAESFFLTGMTSAMGRLATLSHASFPTTIYYAFKQAESDESGVSSTGWATFLEAVLTSGFSIQGTWPMRTELSNRMIGSGTNALASSIVLVCRKRIIDAPMATRSEFSNALKRELPAALKALQMGNIAPVDLPQSSFGPGMAIFSRYAKVIEADGKAMSVKTALQIINAAVDEFLSEQESQMDEWTRFAVTWFSQFAFNPGSFGDAQNIATARGVSVDAVKEAGLIESGGGKVRILKPKELPEDWDPTKLERITVWAVVHHLIRVLDKEGELAASQLLRKIGHLGDDARALCYRLYTLCEQKKWSDEARDYNTLITAWPELTRLAMATPKEPDLTQGTML